MVIYMKNEHYMFAQSLSSFLTEYMKNQRKQSQNTIESYRDTFILIFKFFDEKGLKVKKITFEHINYENIVDFLYWLEKNRNCSDNTVNQRLAAIHSFIKYVIMIHPECIYDFQRILHIKFRKTKQNIINFLTEEQMKELLSVPDCRDKKGLRDQALLSLLYDSAARVQELIHLKVKDIRYTKNGNVTLTGKGNKVRVVPISDNTVAILRKYIKTYGLTNKYENYLFNHQGREFTRQGITYIINKYSRSIIKKYNIKFKITPHIFRHSKSMHMLHSGINLYYIKEILGHSNLTTTEKFYVKADADYKRKELYKMNNLIKESNDQEEKGSWETNDSLLDWLNSL